jgi:hypothetical protein
MAIDFRDGRAHPRSGQTMVEGYAWLARLSDKARAARGGTNAHYPYPSGIDLAVLKRWDLTVSEFDRAILEYPDDVELAAWLEGRVTREARERSNRWVLNPRVAQLERVEEEHATAH